MVLLPQGQLCGRKGGPARISNPGVSPPRHPMLVARRPENKALGRKKSQGKALCLATAHQQAQGLCLLTLGACSSPRRHFQLCTEHRAGCREPTLGRGAAASSSQHSTQAPGRTEHLVPGGSCVPRAALGRAGATMCSHAKLQEEVAILGRATTAASPQPGSSSREG